MAPNPEEVRATREAAGLTQAQAAELVHMRDKARWSEVERGVTPMSPAAWELFRIKCGVHPEFNAPRRRVKTA